MPLPTLPCISISHPWRSATMRDPSFPLHSSTIPLSFNKRQSSIMDRRIRTRTGCITCRRRRVKCDEGKPACLRCRSANFECGGYVAPRSAEDAPRSASRAASKTPSLQESRENSSDLVQDLAWRHMNWKQEELPLYHHFVTTTAVRLFRDDHIGFWRDQVAQMSYGVDIVYEALLAIGAIHRSTLLACKHQDIQGAANMKVLGLKSYGKALRMLPSHLGNSSVPDVVAIMAVLMLLAYFEVCFANRLIGIYCLPFHSVLWKIQRVHLVIFGPQYSL